MPYFVYRVGALGVPTKVGAHADFRDASRQAKALRREPPAGGGRIRVMFADDERAAEDLLSQVREPPPMAGDDD